MLVAGFNVIGHIIPDKSNLMFFLGKQAREWIPVKDDHPPRIRNTLVVDVDYT